MQILKTAVYCNDITAMKSPESSIPILLIDFNCTIKKAERERKKKKQRRREKRWRGRRGGGLGERGRGKKRMPQLNDALSFKTSTRQTKGKNPAIVNEAAAQRSKNPEKNL
jgi:hypothetical protein